MDYCFTIVTVGKYVTTEFFVGRQLSSNFLKQFMYQFWGFGCGRLALHLGYVSLQRARLPDELIAKSKKFLRKMCLNGIIVSTAYL